MPTVQQKYLPAPTLSRILIVQSTTKGVCAYFPERPRYHIYIHSCSEWNICFFKLSSIFEFDMGVVIGDESVKPCLLIKLLPVEEYAYPVGV